MQHPSYSENDVTQEADIVDSMMRVSIGSNPSSLRQRPSSPSSDLNSTRTADGAIIKNPANSTTRNHRDANASLSGFDKSMKIDDMNISIHNIHNSNDSSLSLSFRETQGEDS